MKQDQEENGAETGNLKYETNINKFKKKTKRNSKSKTHHNKSPNFFLQNKL